MAIKPVDTFLNSSIKLPSSLFTLRKYELFPYERFAYNILHIGIEALNKVDLPESITVDYTKLSLDSAPWLINASITYNHSGSGDLLGFEVNLPEFLPVIIHLYIHIVANQFFDYKNLISYNQKKESLKTSIQSLFDVLNKSVQCYKKNTNSIGLAVREAYSTIGYGFNDLNDSSNHFDLLTKLIANHEIAHAYLGQLSDWKGGPQIDYSAYELLADLLAIEWFYIHMIKNTPQAPEYFKMRGVKNFSEALCRNVDLVFESHQSLLLLMGIAGAQRTRGKITLQGSGVHPNGLLRHLLQHCHLYTLLHSNYSSDLLDEKSINFIDKKYDLIMKILLENGFISTQDVNTLINGETYQILERAIQIIEEKKIQSLENIKIFLRSYIDTMKENC